MLKYLAFCCMVLCLQMTVYAQPCSPNDSIRISAFGEDYTDAADYVNIHRWMWDTLFKHGFDPAFTLAIVFPELIRYSSLRDYIEVHSLEVLYVQYGKAYSDFSVGRFQIKPSFAEKLEADAIRLNITDGHSFLSPLVLDTSSSSGARKARVERLTDIYDQVLYIELFTLVMNTLYPDWYRMPALEKLDFYATAYNAGYYKGEGHILAERYKKRFYTGVFPGSAYYSYTMIARRAWCLLQSLLSL